MVDLIATAKCPTYKEGEHFDAHESLADHLVKKGYAVREDKKPAKEAAEKKPVE